MKSKFLKVILGIIIAGLIFLFVDFLRIKTNNYPIFCPIIITKFETFNSIECYGLGYKVNCYIKTINDLQPDGTISTDVEKRFDLVPYWVKYEPEKYFPELYKNSAPITIIE